MSLEQSLLQSTAMAILNSDSAQNYGIIRTIETAPSGIDNFLDRRTDLLDRKLSNDIIRETRVITPFEAIQEV